MIEIGYILGDDATQMRLTQDQDMIQTFSSHTAEKAFAHRIRFRSPDWCFESLVFPLWGLPNRSPRETEVKPRVGSHDGVHPKRVDYGWVV